MAKHSRKRSPNKCDSGVVMLPFTSDPRQHLHYRSKPKKVQMARRKHQPLRPELGTQEAEPKDTRYIDRFFALPSEIRNHIWRLLLVQPRKFNMYHINKCTKNNALYPGPAPNQMTSWKGSLCAKCQNYPWHHLCAQLATIYESPLRSKWARPLLNPFLCDTCHWDVVGRKMDRLDPALKLLPCICTRRENLDVLLVNKRIHDEAAYVFWNENWFCFEHLSQLAGLLKIIRPHIKSWIRSMTIMPYTEDEHEPERLLWMPAPLSWRSLPEFTGLVDVEIDIGLLSNLNCVLDLRNLHVQRSVSFVRQLGRDEDVEEGEARTYPGGPGRYIWPERARRQIVHTPLTEALEQSMRRRPLKTKVLKRAFAASGLLKT